MLLVDAVSAKLGYIERLLAFGSVAGSKGQQFSRSSDLSGDRCRVRGAFGLTVDHRTT